MGDGKVELAAPDPQVEQAASALADEAPVPARAGAIRFGTRGLDRSDPGFLWPILSSPRQERWVVGSLATLTRLLHRTFVHQLFTSNAT